MGGALQLFERPQGGERAVLVGVGIGHPVDPNDMAEFAALAASAGTVSVGTVLASRARPDPKYFVGSGKAEEIHAFAEAQHADLVLVDQTLTPSQERNLEKLTGRRVLDRNGLILDIFAQRARSFEGKLQVELAQLSHLATRLVRGWTHLERQKGGIGLRGPGETQLETDRRLIAKRIRTLRSRLEKLDRQRDTGRHVRREVPVPTVALVGYTNAGKSTLFNVLTGSETFVANQLFATLDPTVRRVKLADVGEVVLGTRWDSFVRCRTNSSPPFVRRCRRRATPICCCMSSMPAIRGAMSASTRCAKCSAASARAISASCWFSTKLI